MSNPAKRLIYTIVTALVFLGIYAGTMFYVEKQHYEKLIAMHNRSQTDSLRGILDRYEHTETEIGKLFYDELNTEVRLKALSLAAGMTDGQYGVDRVMYSHLEDDSAYNTYKIPGLPPGPICNPGIEAIMSVLYPEEHNYLFFMMDSNKNDGSNLFFETYDELYSAIISALEN